MDVTHECINFLFIPLRNIREFNRNAKVDDGFTEEYLLIDLNEMNTKCTKKFKECFKRTDDFKNK